MAGYAKVSKLIEISEKIKQKQLEKALLKANLNYYTQTSKSLDKIMAKVDKNTRDLMHLRTELLRKESGESGSAQKVGIGQMMLLLYSNIIQQNISYLSALQIRALRLDRERLELQKKLNEIDLATLALKNQIENLRQKRDEELEKDKAMLVADIQKLKAHLRSLRAFEILQPATSSINPVRPRKRVAIGVSGVLGLLVGFILVLIFHRMEQGQKRAGD